MEIKKMQKIMISRYESRSGKRAGWQIHKNYFRHEGITKLKSYRYLSKNTFFEGGGNDMKTEKCPPQKFIYVSFFQNV